MVVTKLKRDCGRPDRLRESVERLGVRKKERDGGIWLADASPEDGDRGDETKDDRTDESWTMGGKAGLRCDWEVGDPRGECEGEDRELWTYGCLGS